MICHKSDKNSSELTSSMLLSGKIVIIPTDTVYGFSGIADTCENGFSFKTDRKICAVKGRAENKPLIQLISSPEEIRKYSDTEIPEKLLGYWPGPITLIVKQKNSEVTTAFRCPGDEWLRKVIACCGAPVYSTSVNRSGKPVLKKIKEIIQEFEKDCSLIVDAGDCSEGIPSTIVSVANGKIEIIRKGALEISI